MFSVLVNWAEIHTIASADDADRLCDLLAGFTAFTAHAVGPTGECGPTLDVAVVSGRGMASFLDMSRGVKLLSRDHACSDRTIVSLANDSHPGLQLDQIEGEQRDLISPSLAIAILRHFLATGEPTDLMPWPPEDWDDRPAATDVPEQSVEEIPF